MPGNLGDAIINSGARLHTFIRCAINPIIAHLSKSGLPNPIAAAVVLALLAFALGWVGSTQAQGQLYNILLTAPLEKGYSGDTPVLTSDVIGGCINQADCANSAGVDLDTALQSISSAIDTNTTAINAIDSFTLPPGAFDEACLAWSDVSGSLVWRTC